MSFVGNILGDVVGGITGAKQQAKAAQGAASTQAAAAREGIGQILSQSEYGQDLLRRLSGEGIDALRGGQARVEELAAPFIGAGRSSLDQMLAITGSSGPDAQRAALAAVQASPELAALTQQGESAILGNASATGGLRGGNTQAALAQFRPQLLSQLINQQYARLGGLSNLGMSGTNLAASGALQTGQGIAGNALQTGITGAGLAANTGGNIAQLLQQEGAATAGGQIAKGNQAANAFNTAAGLFGGFAGLGGIPGLKKLF